MNDVLLDRLELGFLSGLQDQRNVQARVRSQTQAGLQAMRSSGMPAASTSSTVPSSNGTGSTEEEADAGGIINRSPTTHYHYYQQATAPPAPTVVVEPTPAPAPAPVKSGLSPWWLLIPVAIVLAGAIYLLWPKTPPAVQPAPVAVTPRGQDTIDIQVIPGPKS